MQLHFERDARADRRQRAAVRGVESGPRISLGGGMRGKMVRPSSDHRIPAFSPPAAAETEGNCSQVDGRGRRPACCRRSIRWAGSLITRCPLTEIRCQSLDAKHQVGRDARADRSRSMTANRSGAFRAKGLSREPGRYAEAPVALSDLRDGWPRVEQQGNGYDKRSKPAQAQHRPARSDAESGLQTQS